ncbi:barstar family protein [Actinosynnema sp. NPDC020468]|uniref:barstar family protein n=1 Tax=Actinosynnema sp. NPDC020468 TaxID=3154488 RepID=UPI0034109BAC
MTFRHVVADGVHGRRAVLEAIGEALDFPDYYGRNLDALYDLASDLSWLPVGEHVLVWSGGDPGVERVLADAVVRTAGRARFLTVEYPD